MDPITLTGNFEVASEPKERGGEYKYYSCDIKNKWGFNLGQDFKEVTDVYELRAKKAPAETLKTLKVGDSIYVEVMLRSEKRKSKEGNEYYRTYLQAKQITKQGAEIPF